MKFSQIGELPVEYIYALLFIVATIPILMPLGLPVVPSSITEEAYQAIEDLPDNSVVVFDWSASAGYGPELETQCVAIFRHLLSRPLKIIIISTMSSDGPMMYDLALTGSSVSGRAVDPLGEYGKIYGEDYVYLGYIPGREAAMAAIARDTWMTTTDDAGTPLEEIPIMEFCRTWEDWDLTIFIAGSAFEEIIGQWNSAYGLPIIIGGPGVSCPRIFPYYAADQVKAVLISIRASAEYEVLIGEFGLGRGLMDVLNLAQLICVVSIVVCNLAYWIPRLSGEK